MKTGLILAAMAASVAMVPAAMAQQTYSQGYSTYSSQNHSGSTGGDLSGLTGSAGVTSSDLAGRRGRGQKPVELQQTTLLNQLSAAGYVSVRDFRKEGDRYVANAMTPQGQWTTVVLDPRNSSTTRATTSVVTPGSKPVR
ncbi:hypothetical protein GBZ48_16225 [Azospirillum melinis]|uniref:PepSY domain-containing protein n=1 Tax=Azospirillum melinis TaxID=328839 RepID=A0ABX2KB48_9PROT|nr:hypothetical protein [Azospirillum melinis]MBP2304407.1 hypothetical protein [Azospirillum melinis]NUB00828.1 hypothetical protein [Azospirillum melinis]